jgi:Protein of unknown function (DUF2924)
MCMAKQISALQRLTVKELRTKFGEVFGEATNAGNRDWLIKRVAWRMQSLEQGGLTERAKRRAEELANEADLRVVPPRERAVRVKPPAPATHTRSDGRLPPPGTIITRQYKGDTLQVKVLSDGFEYDGYEYPSLSAVAKAITGSHCNGFLFFRLARKGGKS